MIQNPAMLPKVRSTKLTKACKDMPCTLRIASIFGHSCAPQQTVVPVHLPVHGKGTATKVTDLAVVAGCMTCHDILDGRPAARRMSATQRFDVQRQMLMALVETHARLVDSDIIHVPGEVLRP
jgi:hypothetical protein